MFNLEEERLIKENNDLKDKVESLEEIFNQNLTSELVLKGYLNLTKDLNRTDLYQSYKKIYIDLFFNDSPWNLPCYLSLNSPFYSPSNLSCYSNLSCCSKSPCDLLSNRIKFFIQNYPGDLTRTTLDQILQNECLNNTSLNNTSLNNILLEINRNDLIHNFVCISNCLCIYKTNLNICNSIRLCHNRR